MTWEKVTVGERLPCFVDEPLTVTDFVRYQGASGDMNPIHHDSEFSVSAGFHQPFAVGMRQAGILGTYATRFFGPESIRRLTVRFLEQAWPGDVLTYSALVTQKIELNDQNFVELALEVRRPNGKIHIAGSAMFAISRASAD